MEKQPDLIIEVFRIRKDRKIVYGWRSMVFTPTNGEYKRLVGQQPIQDHRHIFQSILGHHKKDLMNPERDPPIRSVERNELISSFSNDDSSEQIGPVSSFIMDEIQDNYDTFKRAEKPPAPKLKVYLADESDPDDREDRLPRIPLPEVVSENPG